MGGYVAVSDGDEAVLDQAVVGLGCEFGGHRVVLRRLGGQCLPRPGEIGPICSHARSVCSHRGGIALKDGGPIDQTPGVDFLLPEYMGGS